MIEVILPKNPDESDWIEIKANGRYIGKIWGKARVGMQNGLHIAITDKKSTSAFVHPDSIRSR